MNQQKKDNTGIVRFLMAIYIAVFHYAVLLTDFLSLISYEKKGISAFIMLGGSLPVCFFVLSGFVISYKAGYLKKISTGEYQFKEYILKRSVKLYPLMIISALIWTFMQWIYFYITREWWTGRVSSLWNLLATISGFGVGGGYKYL